MTDTATDHAPSGFAALGLRAEVLESLADLGYDEPTPIQNETIPTLIAGADLLGQAATGTGKTAAFALPIIHRIGEDRPDIPQALIIVPTRELAMQVSDAMIEYGRKQRISVVPVYGGQPAYQQLKALSRGAHVVVATPGRAKDLISRGGLALEAIETVVLDEADEMLDMGFAEDIEAILQATPNERQTVMFSATLPPRINAIAKKYQKDPVRISVGRPEAGADRGLVRQAVYMVHRAHKASALGRILDIEAPEAAIVFCKTRNEVDDLTETMNARGYRAEALHGGMDQSQRDRVMARLRDGTAELLVATDVAARGLDVDTLTHVVNYDVPTQAESYVHRIGRVGRAGREGVAITLAEPKQRRLLNNIERLTKQSMNISKVPTVEDLRARQLEQTVAKIREALSADDLEDFNPILHALTGDDSDRNLALAAMKLVHEALNPVNDEHEIPDANAKGKDRGRRDDRGQRTGKGPSKGRGAPKRGGSRGSVGSVYVGLGRQAGIRPGDLVGAIANEANLSGSDIGPIRIADYYSVVGVPEDSVDRVVAAINGSSIRNKRTKARRFVE